MSISQWLSVSAAICQLVLALVALARGTKPLKWPMALLCLDIAGWTAASSTYSTFRAPVLSWIDHVLSPFTAVLTLDFVLVFTGVRRSSHWMRRAALLLAGSLSLASMLSFQVPSLHWFVGSHLWGTWLVAGLLPTMAVALLTLLRHRRSTVDPEERARCSLLLLVFGFGTGCGFGEEVGFLNRWISIADIGMLFCGVGMAVVTIRYRLFGGAGPEGNFLFFGGLAALTLLVGTVVLSCGGIMAVAAALLAMGIVLLCAALASERIVARAVRAERTKQLVTLGRFSAQMDHDVKNPLAALKGAAQLLRRDLMRPEPTLNHLEFTQLMLEQVERIDVILGRYRKLSRLEVNRSETELNHVVRSVAARQAPAMPAGIELRCDVGLDLPPCAADPDLLATVVENLVRNSIEAMPAGGTITITTAAPGGARVELVVRDDGMGMDARTCERATDDFFTTKATGNGFGLAFTKRVMEAHDGGIHVTSVLGRGTAVRVWMPAYREESARAADELRSGLLGGQPWELGGR
jgi:two-component system, NtrC family, sensor histidine kinase HydH